MAMEMSKTILSEFILLKTITYSQVAFICYSFSSLREILFKFCKINTSNLSKQSLPFQKNDCFYLPVSHHTSKVVLNTPWSNYRFFISSVKIVQCNDISELTCIHINIDTRAHRHTQQIFSYFNVKLKTVLLRITGPEALKIVLAFEVRTAYKQEG